MTVHDAGLTVQGLESLNPRLFRKEAQQRVLLSSSADPKSGFARCVEGLPAEVRLP